MGKSKFPYWLTYNIEDERLRRLLQRVWERLPAYDRAVIRELVLDVNNYSDEEHMLGSAGTVDPSSVWSGNAGNIVKGDVYTVSLGGTKNIRSDAACMHVIAHEFAHVVLRHNQMSLVVGGLLEFRNSGIYSDSDLDQLNIWHEEEADLLVWSWGFTEETRAFYEEFPEAEKPRWFVEIEPANMEDLSTEEKKRMMENLFKEQE